MTEIPEPPRAYASLAIVLLCLTFLLSNAASFWAGRMVEQRSELGKLLVYAPSLEDLRAATQFEDSVSMQFMLQTGRLHRPQRR